ncbi:MerR family transcriptional regulator [Sphingomonas rhizophila]|uniref:MerR family transcriptional regulator n=1 Tax=Sphingomonas rhizophila TaxID=2071607 RepID=A0A7G9SB51_9SPHN|nr:MerR family transcriptional regulator [Sphingomonas rhizophila]QNN65076.1 MerR family transcriptional regulator [Sphingomonas rhizophila]
MAAADKAPDAFRTIGELSAELGVAQHILRYWETKFPQLRPLQRAGNRRYYRPADVQLVRRIHRLLSEEGYTVKGVQKLLKNGDASPEPVPASQPAEDLVRPQFTPADLPSAPPPASVAPALDLGQLIRIRDRLQDALAE